MTAKSAPDIATAPTFALALGGGGARGLAHIHVLEVLDEMGIRPTAIAGTSIGAILGAIYASGLSGKELRDYAGGILTRPTEVAARVWKARSGIGRSFRAASFDIERILRAFLPKDFPASFAELKSPLQVAATDFYGHRLHVCGEGDLISAIGASGSLPAVFDPVWRDGQLLIDGGFMNPVPWDLVLDKADITIAIDVVGAPEPGLRKTPGRVDLLYGSSQLVMQSIIAAKLEKSRPAILLRPPVSRFRVLDFLKFEEIMGETATLRDDLKRQIEAARAVA